MANIEELVRFENENTALKFRARQYDSKCYDDFLIDVLAMANARIKGQRVIVLGVDADGRDRTIKGIKLKSPEYGKELSKLISEHIEPPVKIEYSMFAMDDKTLGLILIANCDDQPYMMKDDFSLSLRTGDAWVRKGSHQVRMTRSEFDSIYEKRFEKAGFSGSIKFGFGKNMNTVFPLPILSGATLPSDEAAKKIRAAIKAKEAADQVLDPDDTAMGRLMHVKFFGADAPFEMQTIDSLKQNLAMARNEYRSHDLYYLFEKQAHRVNFTLVNQGGELLQDASVTLEFPRVKGMDVAERIFPAPPKDGQDPPRNPAAELYPNVERGDKKIQVCAGLGDVPQGKPIAVLGEPLRLLLRKEVAGKSIPVRYTIYARNLGKPVTGKLQITVLER